MDASEPRVRHRGFFLHSDTTGESDTGEHENPEGFVIRVRFARRSVRRQGARRGATPLPIGNGPGGRAKTSPANEDGRPEIRSGSATGIRQPAHLPR
jgi:hypothetical protein